MNFSFFGEEGDVFGNVLAVLCGALERERSRRTLDALLASGVHEPYPVRAVVQPIRRQSALWRPYMARHRQNSAWQYHNGGVWPMVGGFWVAALARLRAQAARARRAREARARVRARRLGIRRVAARPHVCAARHARPIVERGGLLLAEHS